MSEFLGFILELLFIWILIIIPATVLGVVLIRNAWKLFCSHPASTLLCWTDDGKTRIEYWICNYCGRRFRRKIKKEGES